MSTPKSYIEETKKELKKVSWPESDSVLNASWVVIILIFAMAVIFFSWDILLKFILQTLSAAAG